jgi:hypothetical protein
MPAWPMLIMKIGPPPGASRTHWNPAFTASERIGSGVMAFQLARYTRTVLLTVPE